MKRVSDLLRQAPLDLWKEGEEPDGAVLVVMGVMQEISRGLKKRNLSREQLADYLNKKLHHEFQRTTLDMWFAEAKADKWPPLHVILLMCDFIQSFEPLQILAQSRKLLLIEEEEQKLLEVGRAAVDKQVMCIREERLAEKVQGVIAHRIQRGELKF